MDLCTACLHFTARPKISFAPTVLQLTSFHHLFRVELADSPTDALRLIIPNNACILYITAIVCTEIIDTFSSNTVIASYPGKEVHDP